MEVTFVMPAFNAEKFIRQSIESIQAQTVGDWRLIVVNDGSTDGTAKIVREMSARDARIRCVDNEGASGSAFLPRKKAVGLAETEYVSPLDADDLIPEDYLEQLLARKEETGADIVYPTMYTFAEDVKEAERFTPLEDSPLYGAPLAGRDCVKLTLDGWQMGANGGLIPKELFLKACVRIPSELESKIYIDEVVTRYLLTLAAKVCASEAKYFYRMNPGSVTHVATSRSFENCYSNWLLLEFCRDEFGAGSEECILAHRQNFHWIFDAMRRLNREQLSRRDKQTVSEWIRQSIASIDFPLLKPHVSPRYYALIRCHNILPIRHLLKVIDNFQ